MCLSRATDIHLIIHLSSWLLGALPQWCFKRMTFQSVVNVLIPTCTNTNTENQRTQQAHNLTQRSIQSGYGFKASLFKWLNQNPHLNFIVGLFRLKKMQDQKKHHFLSNLTDLFNNLSAHTISPGTYITLFRICFSISVYILNISHTVYSVQ